MKKKSIFLVLCLVFIIASSGCNNKDPKKTQNNLQNKYSELPDVTINETGFTWPEGQALPAMAPLSDTIDLVHTSGAFTGDQIATVTVLQGLVNREKPRIFVIKDSDRLNMWRDENDQIKTVEYKGKTDAWNIFEKYKNYYKGFIVYDTKNKSAAVNLATTVAGLKDCLPVSEKTLNKLKELGIDLPVVDDFRNKFSSDIEVYQHLYDNYWKDCSRRVFFSMDPAVHIGYIRDLAVAVKGAVVWLDPTKKDGLELLNKFLSELTPGKSIIMGWWTDETQGIKTGSKHGISTVPSDFYENYTIHAGTVRKLSIPPVPDVPKLENKIYIAVTLSDGDNLQYNQHAMQGRWKDPKRGQIPVTWTISPALIDAGPDILNYYYRTATPNDCFVSGPSGIGYASVENMTAEQLDIYAKWSDKYLAKTGLRFVTAWNNLTGEQSSIYIKSARSVIGLSIQRWDGKSEYNVENSVPIVPQVPNYGKKVDDLYNNIVYRINQSQYNKDKPVLLAAQAVAWDLGVSDILKLQQKLNDAYGEDNIEFIRLDQLLMLISMKENKPYNLCLSQDTVFSSSDDSVNPKLAGNGSASESNMWSSSKAGEKWLSIDLGSDFSISRYVMKNAGAGYLDKSLNTKNYRLMFSTDGTNWSLADEVKNNTDNVRDVDFSSPIKARYLKVIIDDPGSDGTARIGDIEVYGHK